jgi:hypothetical protein
MNTKILAAVIAAALISGCSSLYKATSTPDDIYYSPAPATAEVTDAGYDRYENYTSSNEDRYLRMKVQNQTLWSSIDDYSYWNDSRYDYGYSCNTSRQMLLTSFYNPYGYGYGLGFNNYGMAYGFGYGYGWSNWSSPYQTIVLYKNPKVYFNNTNKSNLTAYRNIQYNNSNNTKYASNGGYQNSNYYPTRNGSYYNNTTNNNYTPSRSFSTSSSSNSAGGRSGGFNSAGSSAGSSRPARH